MSSHDISREAAEVTKAADPLHICLLCMEIFAWGKYGGFGRATRTIGRELVKAGHRVTAIVPMRDGQAEEETLDGIRVLGYPEYQPWRILRLAKMANAQVYHSCEPSFATFLARVAMPERRHMVTIRDPRAIGDWRTEISMPSVHRAQVAKNFLFEHNTLVTWAVRRTQATFTAYKDAIPKAQRIYALSEPPRFLPTPVHIPGTLSKDDRPTVSFVSRLDRRKRPELVVPLAKEFPNVTFLVAGVSRDKDWEARLLRDLNALPNVRTFGFVDQFRSSLHSEILARSWVFLNTAGREGLPNSFIESAAHGCAILSSNNPDGFASRFGYHASEEDFVAGLGYLLEGDRWRALGEAGRKYVADTFQCDLAMARHIDAYREVCRDN